MKKIPINEMTIERLRAELRSSINLNELLSRHIKELKEEIDHLVQAHIDANEVIKRKNDELDSLKSG